VIVEGKVVPEDGALAGLDERAVLVELNSASLSLLARMARPSEPDRLERPARAA
jgi:hypothetical protein